MALLATEGFDHYASGNDLCNRVGFLQWSPTSIVYNCNSGSRTPYGYSALSNKIVGTLSASASEHILGMGLLSQNPNVSIPVEHMDGNTIQFYYSINPANGQVSMYTGAGTLVAQSNLNQFNGNIWNYFEFKTTFGSTTGTAAVRVNGQALAGLADQTGIDTQNSANASANGFIIGSGSNFLIDDFYICDGTTGAGSYPNNNFLGNFRCSAQFPTGNNSVTWTPLTGTNWSEVDNVAGGSDAAYNRSATAGNADYLNFGTIATDIGQVNGLQVTACIRLETAGPRTVAPMVYIGTTAYQGTAYTLSTNYSYLTTMWSTNPATGASWTTAAINAASFGYKIVS
jgi:hypothetical protein